MEELPESPVPAGAQEVTPADAMLPVVLVDTPIPGGLSELIFDLADSNGRSLGAGAVPRLVAAHVKELTKQLNRTSEQLHDAQGQLHAKTAELGEVKTELALAKQEAGHSAGTGSVQLLLNSVGLVLVGIGLELYKSDLGKPANILVGLGVFLVVAGWVLPLVEKRRGR